MYATMAGDTCHDFVRTPTPTFNIEKLSNEMKVDYPISSYAEAKNKEALAAVRSQQSDQTVWQDSVESWLPNCNRRESTKYGRTPNLLPRMDDTF